ncbi:MAG: FISUMP domain-containing protein [Mangrovibacterium sp.]
MKGIMLMKQRLPFTIKKYGVLYNYASALESCPVGWHLPSDPEWKELEKFIGMKKEEIELMQENRGDVGEKLKSIQFWDDEVKGTDEYGFCAIPAGFILQGKDFDKGAKFLGEGELIFFWTSDEKETRVGKILAIRRSLDNSKNGMYPSANKYIMRYPIEKSAGLSVRCIKDE